MLLDSRKLDMAYQRLGYSFLSTLLISLSVVAGLFPSVPAYNLLSWLIAMCAIQLVRFIYYRRYLKLAEGARVDPGRWHTGYVIGAAAAGLCWGSSIFSFTDSPLDPASFLLIFVLAGVAAFASVSMATLPRAVAAFMLTTLLPLAGWLFTFNERIYLVMGGIVIAYLILMLLLARQIHSVYLKSLLSSEQNRELSEAVRERDRRAQVFFDSAPGCYFTLRRDDQGILSMPFASVGLTRLVGVDPEKVTDNIDALLKAINPDDIERMLSAFNQSALLRTPCKEEFRITGTSQRQKVVEFTAQPQPGAAGSRQVEWHGFIQDITERRLLEEELWMKGYALDHTSDALYLIDEQGQFVYVNEQASRSMGYSREELQRMGVPDIDSNFADPVLLEEFEKTKKDGGRFAFETIHRRRDGSVFPVEIQTSFLEYNGQLLGVSLVRDISERKRAETELAQREQEFRSLAESAPDNIVRYDCAGRHRYLNRRLVQQLGLGSMDEVIGKRPSEIWLDGRFAKLEEAAALVVVNGESCELEMTEPDGNGGWLHYVASLVPERDARGDIIGTIAFGWNITERKRMELALAAREAEFRSLAENSPDAIFRYDRECRRIYVNQSAEQLTGRSRDELLGRSPLDFMSGPAVDADWVQKCIRVVLEGGKPVELEMEISVADGREVTIHNVFVPEFAADGSVQSVLCMGRDISERKHLEEAMQARGNLLHSILESSPEVIVFALDKNYRYLSFNGKHKQTMRAIWGKEIAIGMSILDVIGSDQDRGIAKNSFDRSLYGESFIEENAFGDEALEREYWQTYYSPIHSDSGEVAGLTCFVMNISERKQAEAELQRRFDEIDLLNDRLEEHAHLLEEQAVEMEASQEQIKQTEAWYRGILHSAPDGMMVVDERGLITQVNAEMERLFGYEAGELVGQTMEVLLPADMRAAHVWMRNGFIGNDASRRNSQLASNLRACRKDGSEFVVDVTLARLPENDYNAGAVCAAVRDATERNRMEEALAQREREFRSLVENVNDVVVRYDLACRRTYVNPAWVRVNGIPAEEAVGKSPLELSGRIRPMSHEFEVMLRDVMASRQMHSMDLVWKDETGAQICFQLEAVPEFDSQRKVIGVLTVARDITERKRMEAALSQREQEFRTLVENAADTVARYGKDLRRLYANPAFADLVEGGVKALLGRKPSEAPGGVYSELYEEKLAYVLAQGVETEFELKWCDKSGRELCSLINLTPEFDKDGKVASVLAVGRDISELHAFRQKIHQMAFYDNLTALPNRALFNDRLRQMLTDANWHGQLAGVMLLDLDRFKAINDTLGHPAGDLLLCDAAARLSHCVRGYDTVARLGGDEFAILLPEIRSGDDLGRVANKILDAFKAPFILEGKEVFVSTSIGIAVYPDDSTDANDLIKQADSAMYFAKRSGRSNFRFYAKNMTESAVERLTLESELRRAIERGELELHYQPKIGLNDYAMRGSEALLRWHNPARGMVPPDQFISIAEDSGLIVEIGQWVLREACRTARDLNGQGRPLHKVAINLSVRQFQSGDLVQTVCDILEETACLPEWIELEITESLLLEECDGVLDMLKAFRAIGITIAIDDFGTGYSALSYLARFPINTLKIDRSFIRTITTESYRAELVKAIISIAHSLGQQVVAEGVETAEQALFLQAHGCHVAQGYLFSKPVARADFFALPGIFKFA